jgi:dTDP-4-dehydrorhamnose reductase
MCVITFAPVYHLSNKEFFAREELARQFVYLFHRLIEKTGAEVVSIAENEFGFLDRRQLKTYLDNSLFEKATKMRFTSMKEVMKGFLGKLIKGL